MSRKKHKSKWQIWTVGVAGPGVEMVLYKYDRSINPLEFLGPKAFVVSSSKYCSDAEARRWFEDYKVNFVITWRRWSKSRRKMGISGESEA